MASLVARTVHKGSGFWSSAEATIWRRVRRSWSSSVLQYRSNCDEELDARVPPSPEASSVADLLADTPLSGEFPLAVQKIETFGADRLVDDRSDYRAGGYESFRIHQTVNATLKGQLKWKAFNGKESPVDNCLRASSNVAQESCCETPRQFGQVEMSLGDRGAYLST